MSSNFQMLGKNKYAQITPPEGLVAADHPAAKAQNHGVGGADDSGKASNTAGPHDTDTLNKLDPTVDSHKSDPYADTTRKDKNKHGRTEEQQASEGTYGPHSSKVANALDPRVDSDGDRKVMGK